jgi:hypothetical protein
LNRVRELWRDFELGKNLRPGAGGS